MMGQELHRGGSFWSFLLSNDKDLADSTRKLGSKDARAVVASTAPTTRVHRGAGRIICRRSIAAGSASAAIATAAGRG
jgi:hypothetical protein